MLYISILEDMITDPNAEEGSTISTSVKEDLSTGLFLYSHIIESFTEYTLIVTYLTLSLSTIYLSHD
jgi:hypothetical protein